MWDTFPPNVAPAGSQGVGGALGYILPATYPYGLYVQFPTYMRAVPSATFYNPSGGAAGVWYNATVNTDSGTASIATSAASVSTAGVRSAIIKNAGGFSDVEGNLITLHALFDSRLGIVL